VRDRAKQVQRILAALEAAKKPRPTPPRDAELGKSPVVKWKPVKVTEYDSIEVVPEAAVGDALAGVFAEYGSMTAEDAIAAASKRLGFKRVGPKIREKLAEALNARVAAGTLTVGEDDRVKVVYA